MRGALWVIGLVACGSGGAIPSGARPIGSSSGPGVQPAPPAASVGGGATTGLSASLVGRWRSPSCGARTYPRDLELLEGGRFTARDLVSPCPAGVSCVWSGVVERSGRFIVDGARLELAVERGEAARGGQALPTTLRLAAGAPVEEGGCAYVAER